jgi:hypothetical protein
LRDRGTWTDALLLVETWKQRFRPGHEQRLQVRTGDALATVDKHPPAEEFGKPPAKSGLEWPPSGYPSARTVRRHLGSFTAGIRAASLEPKERRWSEQAIIEAMGEFERETDRWPRSSDWTVACEDWPSASTVYLRFGTWKAALEAAIRV